MLNNGGHHIPLEVVTDACPPEEACVDPRRCTRTNNGQKAKGLSGKLCMGFSHVVSNN